MAVFFTLFLALGARLFTLQVMEAQALQEKAKSQWTRASVLTPRRGAIYDRTGKTLAISATAYIASASPRQIADPAQFARLLAPILNTEAATLQKRVSDRSKGGVILKRQIPTEIAAQLRTMMAQHRAAGSEALSGLYIEEDARRYYPMGDFACQLIGLTTIDGVGQSGLEKSLDEYLTGQPGRILDEIDGKGRALETGAREYVPSVDGASVILTIDAGVQAIVEQAAREAMTVNGAKAVRILVMDPSTGEILAMCVKPAFDLNEPPRDDVPALNDMMRNRLIADAYEPGSTFKILTTAAALDCGATHVGEGFYCSGSTVVEGGRIRCWGKPHGAQTMAKALQNSCNPVFVELGLRLGVERFYKYLGGFGLGKKTGVDIAGEGGGILIPEAKCKRVDIARIGFGQSVALTPLQLLTAASAAVNGGNLLAPYVVKEVVSPEGESLHTGQVRCVSRPISEKTSAVMRKLLEDVVTHGGGKNAYLKSFRVGGKTGTAQLYRDGVIAADTHIGSFLGFAPMDDPKVAVLVIIDEARLRPDFGSITAAPFAKQILERTLIHLGFAPTGETSAEIKKVSVPQITGMQTKEALKTLREAGLSGLLDGAGAQVIGQLPEAGAEVPEGSLVMLYVEGTEAFSTLRAVPDVTGLSIAEAGRLLASYGLILTMEGSGVAVSQSPLPDAQASPGTRVLVRFDTPR